MGCWPNLQLATPGNPQAKVNPALVETRTQGDKRGEVRGRETEPMVSRAWDSDKQGQLRPDRTVSEQQPDVCAARRWRSRAPPPHTQPLPAWLGPGAAPWLPPHILLQFHLGPGIPEGPTSKDIKTTRGGPHRQQGPREGMTRVTERVDTREKGRALEPQPQALPAADERL